ncbi:DUF2127 domain-containing protein [Acrocarpospora pleiomorpha]|uniref:DUF2127 domain-containing protein n=1 Tax=Acrocarpospora pleiomorpha TaxID=90975 RepID=UPI001479599C|nr:DUF2127 domain-containing protein [Acrocarpospora pleiomorpha]
MTWFKPRGGLDRTFQISIILKGLDGIIELVGGLLLLVATPATINHILAALTRHELSEDPHDFVATHLLRMGHGLTGASVGFAAVYLLLHGIVKVILVTALLRNRLWAYPWMVAFLLVFIVYQLYRISLAPAGWLIALTIFDLLVAWLTWREWHRQRLTARTG